MPGNLRYMRDTELQVREQLIIIDNGIHGTVGDARNTLRRLSLVAWKNTLWRIPYGDSAQGIFGATPPELLHQYGLGIEKKAFDHTWKLVADTATRRRVRLDGPKQALDSRFAMFNCRHADPELPRAHFGSGTYQLSFLTSKEYTALIFQVSLARLCFLVLQHRAGPHACIDDCVSWIQLHFLR